MKQRRRVARPSNFAVAGPRPADQPNATPHSPPEGDRAGLSPPRIARL